MKLKITKGPWDTIPHSEALGTYIVKAVAIKQRSTRDPAAHRFAYYYGLSIDHEEDRVNALAISRVPEILELLYGMATSIPNEKEHLRKLHNRANALLEGLVEEQDDKKD